MKKGTTPKTYKRGVCESELYLADLRKLEKNKKLLTPLAKIVDCLTKMNQNDKLPRNWKHQDKEMLVFGQTIGGTTILCRKHNINRRYSLLYQSGNNCINLLRIIEDHQIRGTLTENLILIK